MGFLKKLFGPAGPPDIEKLKASGNVEKLVAALDYPDEAAVREAAAEALGEIGEPALEILLPLLADKSKHDLAGKALVAVGKPAMDALLEKLRKRRYDSRMDLDLERFLTETLPLFGLPVVEPLLKLTKDAGAPSHVSRNALKAVSDPAAFALLIPHVKDKELGFSAVAALGNIGDARAVDALIDVLLNTDFVWRWSAVDALGKIGDARAVDPLLTALASEDFNMHFHAAEALGRIGDPRGVEKLIATLHDAEQPDAVRRSAAHGLGYSRDPRVFDLLMEALQDPNGDVRCGAAHGLGELQDGRAADALITALGADSEKNVRYACARALSQIGDTRAIKPLVTALDDKAPNVLESVTKALVNFGDESVIQPLVEHHCYESAAKFGSPAVRPLIDVMKNSANEKSRRRSAASALATMYREGRLNARDKQSLLQHKALITGAHTDRSRSNDCSTYHTDEGTGFGLKLD